MADRTSFPDYVVARRPELRRLAYALSGDWHAADDIVQIALNKLYRAWPRVQAAAAEDAYVRKAILRAAIDESRRPWRRETPVARSREDEQRTSDPSSRMDVIRALKLLPPGQHKVMVLRYWLGMSISETASTLGVSEGTVKSQASKAIERLRPLLSENLEGSSPDVQ